MKVLFISLTMPPEGTAAAGLLSRLMREFIHRGVCVEGLALKSNMYDPDRINWEGIDIHYANYIWEYGRRSKGIKDLRFKIKRKITDFIYRDYNFVFRKGIVNALLKKMETLCVSDYDVVIYVSAFYDVAEAVFRYRERHQGRAKYIFYQLDPLQENAVYSSIDNQWLEIYERRIYSSADYVFTTPLIYKCKKGKNWILSNVEAVNFPCVELDACRRIRKHERAASEKRCVYAGLLHPEIRDGSFVLELFSKMQDSSIHLYILGSGQESLMQEYQQIFGGRLHVLGQCNSDECERWLEEADVLIAIGNNVMNQVSSKIFTYMSYGLPMLATCKSAHCPSREYLLPIPNAMIIDESRGIDESLIMEVEAFINDYAGTRLAEEQIKSYAYRYTGEFIGSKMLDVLLNKLCL